jgi:hypothetical protein
MSPYRHGERSARRRPSFFAKDGTLTANTAKDGVIGNWIRVKYTTLGTYAGGTTIQIDVASRSRVQ